MSEHLPTTKQELERKTLDLLSETLHRFNTGRLSNGDANLKAKTVWFLVSGLVDPEITNFAESLVAQIKATPATQSINLWHPTKGILHTLAYPYEGGGLTVTTRQLGVSTCSVTHDCTTDERPAHLKAVIKSLLKGGFQLI